MIEFVPSGVTRYNFGEYAYARFITDYPTPLTFQFSAYAANRGKYLLLSHDEETDSYSHIGFVSNVPHLYTPELISLPNDKLLVQIRMNTTEFTQNDVLYVTLEGHGYVYGEPEQGEEEDEIEGEEVLLEEIYHKVSRVVEVGNSAIADYNITVNVFGFLRDARGDFMSNIPVTFTVLNRGGYFDNTPSTSLNAMTLSDKLGKFEIQLNRNYDYVMAIDEVNYRRQIKLSTLPRGVENVEVDIGTGLGC